VGRDLPLATIKEIEQWVFQSTRPRGARQLAFIERFGTEEFQSTRPRGARPFRIALL